MQWFEFYDIAERDMKLINPTSVEKVMLIGEQLGLKATDRVIDFGCGFAEPLVLWAERFDFSAIGIDFRPYAVERAKARVAEAGLNDRIEIVCGRGEEYAFEKHAFDVVSCMGASFIWNGFLATLQAMKEAVKPGGKLLIGEPYWLDDRVPPQYAVKEKFHTEAELARLIREEGCEIYSMVRAGDDDWVTYETANWRGMIAWLDENPDHPDRQAVRDKLREWQDEYFTYGRRYLGWALYILIPV